MAELYSDEGKIIEIPLSQIQCNPKNVRKIYLRIKELADSIRSVGLLQNLVVVENLEGGYTVKAGERRFRALLRLEKEGYQKPVPCLVTKGSTAELVNLAENTAREGVPVWHEGHRYSELLDAGMLQEQIAEATGKSRQYISYAKTLAEGLHPDTVSRLDKLDSAATTSRLLRNLARMKNVEGEPDRDRQLSTLDKYASVVSNREAPRKRFRSQKWYAGRIDLLMSLLDEQLPETKRIIKAIVRFLKSDDSELNI